MPISIQLSRGLLTAAGEREVFSRIADALLQVHGLGGNAFLAPTVIGHVDIYPEEHSYAGGKPQSLAVIEVKVPSVTFPDQSVKSRFIKAATDIIDELKAGEHPRDRTFINVTYAVDGAWGIAGKAYTNADLGQAIGAAAG